MSSISEELERLSRLHQQGQLSDEEYARAKARLLAGEAASAAAPSLTPKGMASLRRSHSDRWLGGVCAGIAQITDTESWIWRLIFVVLAVWAGTGVLAYLLLWIFVPEE